jgi:hypothetical protein
MSTMSTKAHCTNTCEAHKQEAAIMIWLLLGKRKLEPSHFSYATQMSYFKLEGVALLHPRPKLGIVAESNVGREHHQLLSLVLVPSQTVLYRYRRINISKYGVIFHGDTRMEERRNEVCV